MESIEESTHSAAWQIFEEIGLSKHSVDRVSEIIKEKMFEHNDENNYKQGYHDAIERACEWFKDYLNTEMPDIDDWLLGSPNISSGEERFRKAMEESI